MKFPLLVIMNLKSFNKEIVGGGQEGVADWTEDVRISSAATAHAST